MLHTMKWPKIGGFAGCLTFCLMSSTALAASITSTVLLTDNNTVIGEVVFEDSALGLIIKPQLTGLPQGIHGFHVHVNSNCDHKGMGAGGHLDPKNTNSHRGPDGNGHLGDLPVLVVNDKGDASFPMLAPRLKTADIVGHAIMIHAGADNYTDTPALGGGGARIGCGVIAQQPN